MTNETTIPWILLQPWFYFGVFIITVFLGGIIGYLIFNRIFLRNQSSYLRLTNKELGSEIINLRTRIQTIYIIGPLIGFILAFFGVKTYSDLSEMQESQLKRVVKEWIDNSQFKEDLEALETARPVLSTITSGGDEVAFIGDLSSYQDEEEVDVRIEKYFARHITGKYISTDPSEYRDFFRRYLEYERYMKDAEVEAFATSKKEFIAFKEKHLNDITNLSDLYLSKADYQSLIEDYRINKKEFVSKAYFESNFKPELDKYMTSNINADNILQSLEQLTFIKELVRKAGDENIKGLIREEVGKVDFSDNLLAEEDLISKLRTAFDTVYVSH